ncbi:hypothetical protein ACFFX0_16720 [Citricoccus parietis]|uniref:Uncharacterized protein n=1 Tax=Citricoccus parietis TaxID=592307 RepID=A0ABV5G1E0_9MICC
MERHRHRAPRGGHRDRRQPGTGGGQDHRVRGRRLLQLLPVRLPARRGGRTFRPPRHAIAPRALRRQGRRFWRTAFRPGHDAGRGPGGIRRLTGARVAAGGCGDARPQPASPLWSSRLPWCHAGTVAPAVRDHPDSSP